MTKIGDLLVEQGKISERDVERTLLAQGEMGGMFCQVLVKLGLVSEQDATQALSQQLGIPLCTTADYPASPIRLEGVALDFLLSNNVVPIAADESCVVFAAGNAQDPFLARALAMALDGSVDIRLGLESDISRAVQLYMQEAEQEDGQEAWVPHGAVSCSILSVY